jgi:proline dehydrogenase
MSCCYLFQAIDHTVKALSLVYNKIYKGPVIFNTYQAYLKGSKEAVLEDMERARREKYIFAAKLVGALGWW